jgi:hypothetical protein
MNVTCKLLTQLCLATIMTPSARQQMTFQIMAYLPPSQHITLLEQVENILSTQLMGLHCITAPKVNLQPFINTIMVGLTAASAGTGGRAYGLQKKESSSIAMWLGVKSSAWLFKYCGIHEEQDLAPL